jgi:hypothetical protein
MRSIFVRVEPTVRLVKDAEAVELLIVVGFLFAMLGRPMPNE